VDTYPTWPNLAAMMFGLARAEPQRPMLRVFREGKWQGITWGEFGRRTASLARHLRAAGIAAGERVAIVSENRPEYPMAETALMAIRAVPVPMYATNTVSDHAHILTDCGARAAIVSSQEHAAKLRRAGGVELIVVMEEAREMPSPWATGIGEGAMSAAPPPAPLTQRERETHMLLWSSLISDAAPPDDIALEAAGIDGETLACLIYTSGTGGVPKGVMLPHRSILSNCRGAFELLRPLNLHDEVYLSYLPASHSYEHTVGQFFLPSIGTEIVYSRGVEHLAADLLGVKPTIMTVVPRVLEVIRGRVLTQVAHQPAWRGALFEQAMDIGLKRVDAKPLTPWERILDPLLDHLVRKKVRARFGGRLVAACSGGARLEPEVGRFFLALGLKILQGYGQTEAGPIVSANPPDAIRIDTVGHALQGVELRIANDGEILVRGDLVMHGYWNRPEDTATAIENGWLHTGDIGVLDDGYLRITDRKKDVIVLSGGENISPAKVEGMLMAEAEIAQAVVAGDGRAGLSALVVPAEGFDDVAVAIAVNRTNHRLSVTERIRKHAIVPPFTLENGLLTPTQKIRRLMVIRANAKALAALH
jgi:long-chain acyl-CoA synthetase